MLVLRTSSANELPFVLNRVLYDHWARCDPAGSNVNQTDYVSAGESPCKSQAFRKMEACVSLLEARRLSLTLVYRVDETVRQAGIARCSPKA